VRATRRAVLAGAGGAAAAAGAVGLIAGRDDGRDGAKPVPVAPNGATSRTTDRFGLGDAGIANFLLTLQRVEADLYEHAAGRALFREFAAQEREHVARLERAVHDLGTHTVAPPRTRPPSGGAAAFLQYARTVEDLAAAACLGQLRAIDTPELLRVILSIHTVDARHAAVLAEMAGLDPAPDGALAQPLDAATVLARLRPLLRV
jgi:hypothetical protein